MVTRGFWLLVWATPFRGRAIPCHFITYSSKTIRQEASSRNLVAAGVHFIIRQTDKLTYGQAFGIYALAEDHLATGDAQSLDRAIKGSWLLMEAAEVLGDPDLLAQAREAALQMAHVTLEQAVDADGGLFSEGDLSGVTDRAKGWWPQAEAVVGFLNAYQLSGDARFLAASLASWRFIKEHIVDKEYGNWFWAVDEAGRPYDREKAGPWKAAYHSGRACLEVMAQVQKLTDGA